MLTLRIQVTLLWGQEAAVTGYHGSRRWGWGGVGGTGQGAWLPVHWWRPKGEGAVLPVLSTASALPGPTGASPSGCTESKSKALLTCQTGECPFLSGDHGQLVRQGLKVTFTCLSCPLPSSYHADLPKHQPYTHMSVFAPWFPLPGTLLDYPWRTAGQGPAPTPGLSLPATFWIPFPAHSLLLSGSFTSVCALPLVMLGHCCMLGAGTMPGT